MAQKPQTVIPGELVIGLDPLVPSRQIVIRSDNVSGRFGIYFTEDAGVTFLPLIVAPSAEARDLPGSFLTLGDDRGAVWLHNPVLAERARQSVLRHVVVPLSTTFISALFTNAVFGIFRSPRGARLRVTEMHMSVQTQADQAILIEIVDATGAKLANSGTNWIGQIASGQKVGIKQFATPLLFADSTSYRLKINQCGTEANPGEVLEVRLITELVF